MRIAPIAAVMALASSTLAISASQVQANINKTSRLAIQANNDASKLGGLDVSMQLSVVLDDIRQIINAITDDLNEMQKSPPNDIDETGQRRICSSFRVETKIQTDLARTLTDMSRVLSDTPYGASIESILRILRNSDENFGSAIAELVPYCAEGAMQNAQFLDDALKTAVDAYSSSD